MSGAAVQDNDGRTGGSAIRVPVTSGGDGVDGIMRYLGKPASSDSVSLTPLAWLASATFAVALLLHALQQTLRLPSDFGIEDVLGWSSSTAILAAVRVWCEFGAQRWRAGAAYLFIDTAFFMPFYGLLILTALRSMASALQVGHTWVARGLARLLWPTAWACVIALWVVDAVENFGGVQRLGLSGWAYGGCLLIAVMLFAALWRWAYDEANAAVPSSSSTREIWSHMGLLLLALVVVAWLVLLQDSGAACQRNSGEFALDWAHHAKPYFILLALTPFTIATLVWWFGMDLDSHDPEQAEMIQSRAAKRSGAFGIIGRSRYVLLLLALFAVFTLVLDQCRDVLLALARPVDGAPHGIAMVWRVLVLALGALGIGMLSYSCWLWARVVGMVKRPGMALPNNPMGDDIWNWLGAFARDWARVLSILPLAMVGMLVAHTVGDAAAAARGNASNTGAQLPYTVSYLFLFGAFALAIGFGLLRLRRKLHLPNLANYYNNEPNVYALLWGRAGASLRRPANSLASAWSTAPEQLVQLALHPRRWRLWTRLLRTVRWLTLPVCLPLVALALMGILRLGMAWIPNEAAQAPATMALLCLSLTWWMGVAGIIALAEQRQAIPWGLFLLLVIGAIAMLGYGNNHIVPLNAPLDATALFSTLAALRHGGLMVVALLMLLGAACWFAATYSKDPDEPVRTDHAAVRSFVWRLGVALIAFVLVVWGLRHFDGEHTQLAGPPAPGEPRVSIDHAVDRWIEQLGEPNGSDNRVFIVASEGGGIRSAYWTAQVLAQLHENSGLVSDFDRRSFALSGVSGGAVGEAVFRACLRQNNQGSVLECVTTGFKDLDALSPLIGGMMFEDAFARVLPLKMEDTALFGLLSCTQPGCGYLSRALGFEREWMRKFPALADATGPAQAHEPHLVLNSTWVESGNRTVFTTLPFCQRDMPTAEDAVARLGAQTSLITAAHAAARFPFINPLGAVRKPAVEAASNCAVTDERNPPGNPDTSRPVVGHLADGGYFDNSGTDSLADLWRAVNSKLPSTKWQPQLLLIRNGQIKPGCKERPRQGPKPECLNNKDFPAPQDLAKPLEQPTSNLYIDLLGPAVAVINVSGIGSHARQASADLSATLSKFKPTPSRSTDAKNTTLPVLLLDQIDEGTLVPLGWYLSPAARESLEAQAAQVVARAFVKGK